MVEHHLLRPPGVEHFHAWWRLTREVGETVTIEVRRGAKRVTVELEVIS